MSSYKYASLKRQHKIDNNIELPEDINKTYEDIALNKYKSKLLYDCLVSIRKERKWTNKNMGTMIFNRVTGDILCTIYANAGIVKDIDFRRIIVHASAIEQMNENEKYIYQNIWNDKYLKLNESNMKRNPKVDFIISKEEVCLAEEEKNEKVKKSEIA